MKEKPIGMGVAHERLVLFSKKYSVAKRRQLVEEKTRFDF